MSNEYEIDDLERASEAEAVNTPGVGGTAAGWSWSNSNSNGNCCNSTHSPSLPTGVGGSVELK